MAYKTGYLDGYADAPSHVLTPLGTSIFDPFNSIDVPSPTVTVSIADTGLRTMTLIDTGIRTVEIV